MDGDVAPGRRAGRPLRRATAPCSCSTRPTPCSAPIPTLDGRRGAARRHAVEDPRLARRLRRRARAVRRPARQPGPAVHLHHRAEPGRRRRGAGGARRRALGRGRRPARPPARHVDRVRRRAPVADRPGGAGRRGARAGRVRRAARAGPARAGHPAADRRARHVAPARRALRRAHRRAGRPARRGAGRRSTSPMPRPDLVVVVAGTATEVGKTWVAAALLRRLRAGGRCGSRPASRRSRSRRAICAPTPTSSRPRPARTPPPCARRTGSYAVPMAPPMAAEALGRPPFTVADLVAELTWPDAVDVGAGRDGRRRALADRRRRRQRVTRACRSSPTSSCSSPTPGSARSTPCGCRLRALARPARRGRAQPLRPRRRPAPSATASGSTERDGYDVVTDGGRAGDGCARRAAVAQQGPPA